MYRSPPTTTPVGYGSPALAGMGAMAPSAVIAPIPRYPRPAHISQIAWNTITLILLALVIVTIIYSVISERSIVSSQPDQSATGLVQPMGPVADKLGQRSVLTKLQLRVK